MVKRVTIKKLRPKAYDISIGGVPKAFAKSKREATTKANGFRKQLNRK